MYTHISGTKIWKELVQNSDYYRGGVVRVYVCRRDVFEWSKPRTLYACKWRMKWKIEEKSELKSGLSLRFNESNGARLMTAKTSGDNINQNVRRPRTSYTIKHLWERQARQQLLFFSLGGNGEMLFTWSWLVFLSISLAQRNASFSKWHLPSNFFYVDGMHRDRNQFPSEISNSSDFIENI